MRAVAYTRYGGPDVTRIIDVPRPTPGPAQVLVKVRAAGLNPVDIVQREGAFKQVTRYAFPKVAGNEFSGIVEQVGEGVTNVKPGDAVIARTGKVALGGFAEYAVVDASFVAHAPGSVSLADAAGIPLAGLTALQGLGAQHLNVQPGERLLITGGAGGVGLFAIQLAKLAGAHVTTTASSAGEALVRAAGADVVVDYRTTPIADAGLSFDKVYDLVGGDECIDLVRVVKPGGRILSIAGPLTPGQFDNDLHGVHRWLINRALAGMSKAMRQAASAVGVRYDYFFMWPDGPQLQHLVDLMDAGKLTLHIDSHCDFIHFADAFSRLASRRAKGKVILDLPTN